MRSLLTVSQALENLATESGKIADALINKLKSLRVSDVSAFKSLRKAITVLWSAREIEDFKTRLQRMRDALQFRILISIKEDHLRGLDATSQEVLRSIMQKNHEIAVQTAQIAKQQQIDGVLASRRHQEMLDTITQRQTPVTRIEDITEHVKDQLFFHRQDDRFDDIDEAHRTSFHWTLAEPGMKATPWPNLLRWLREDNGIYWISGKAGSGKSTLMKYLHKDPRTMDALNAWAGDDGLLVITFYFWNAGTDLQRSQEGLLRSLLWQVLVHKPSLCSALFPEQFTHNTAWTDFPTMHQLRRAFRKLADLGPNSTKIAILVDGLDEFDAGHLPTTELTNVFLQICKSANMKALLSSRPLTPFEDAFDLQPKLRLHHLTHDDITMYVEDRLAKSPQLSTLATPTSNEVQRLVEEIVSSASGVFLWVKLVVDSLLGGVQAGDEFHDLWKRLQCLPRDLEDLYSHMLSSVPFEYREQGSRIFQILRCNDQQPTTGSYLYSHEPLYAVQLRFAEASTDGISGIGHVPISDLEIKQMEKVVERRLRSRCAGLLELRTRSISGYKLAEQQRYGRLQSRQYIDYIHRSVADFLKKSDVWANILSFTDRTNFVAPRAMLQAIVMEIKMRLRQHHWPINVAWVLVRHAIHFAQLTEETTGSGSKDLLDEIEQAMTRHHMFKLQSNSLPRDYTSRSRDNRPQKKSAPVLWNDNFLALTVRFGLTMYVRETIHRNRSNIVKKVGKPLLYYAYNPRFEESIRPDLVEILLRNGADPNEHVDGFNIWLYALHNPLRNTAEWIAILKLLIVHGADLNVCIEPQGRLIRWSVLYMWTTGLETSPRSASRDRRIDPHRNGLEEHMPEMQRLLIAKGAISRYWIFGMDGGWIESPVIESDRPAEPGAAIATGVSEGGIISKFGSARKVAKTSRISLEKVFLRLQLRL